MVYKIKLEDNFTVEDYQRAMSNMPDKTDVDIDRKEDEIEITFDGTLGAAVTYLQYLFESNITLDPENYLVQDGKKTKTQLEIILNY